MIKKFTTYIGTGLTSQDCSGEYWEKILELRIAWMECRRLIEGCCCGIPVNQLLPSISQHVVRMTLVPMLEPMRRNLMDAIGTSKRVKFFNRPGGRGASYFSSLFYAEGKAPIFMIDIGISPTYGSRIAMDIPVLKNGEWVISGYWIPARTVTGTMIA